jgi:hypothetical protein
MQDELERILELQRRYRRSNTPSMRERGDLIRGPAASWLRSYKAQLAEEVGIAQTDLLAEGKDGSGGKTRVPWVRFASERWSPKATGGFYVVYLFDANAEAVYLSLNQGTTKFVNGQRKPQDKRLIHKRTRWAQAELDGWVTEHSRGAGMALHDPGLGALYEQGNIASIAYKRGEVPDDRSLLNDARLYAHALGVLYAAQELQPLPGESPEVDFYADGGVEAEAQADPPPSGAHATTAGGNSSKRRGRASGAGFRVNAEEIKLIEQHAVKAARAYYESQGWDVEEHGKPFDLAARKGQEYRTVEVKGTTSDGSYVQLTKNEVAHHKEAYPDNALVVMHGIQLDRSTSPPTVAGGELDIHHGWLIDDERLQPISYKYEVPDRSS